MKHEAGEFATSDSQQLYFQHWRPDQPARAILVPVHGIGEHSGRYRNVAAYLVPRGIAVYGYDHRGHGRSPGQRGYVESWSVFRADLRAFVAFVQEQEPKRPLFLMGQSMGGTVALNYALHHPEGLQGVIASAPAVGKLDVPPALALLSRALANIWPRLSVATSLDVNAISRDTAVVEAYQSDPLVHSRGTPRLGNEFFNSAAWTMDHADRFQPPLLLIHGTADQIVNPQASRDFYKRVAHTDKKLILYDGAYHEPHHDLSHEKVLADLETWLTAHIQ